MESLPLNTLWARVRFALANPNWLLLLAGLLVLLAAVLHMLLLPGREAAIEAGERRLAQLERSTRRLQVERQSEPAQRRSELIDRFFDDSRLSGEVGRLFAVAETVGLQLSAGEYRWVPGKEKLLDRYVINLPLQGSYGDIRQFLIRLREDFPNLAIEDVSLRRDNIGIAEMAAQLRLVLFVRRADSL